LQGRGVGGVRFSDVEEDDEDFIVRETKKRGRLTNLSYFAFTATAKNTLDNVTNIYYKNPQAVDQLEAAISPVVERFDDAQEDDKNRFRDLLTEYVRLYLYLSQIIKFTDVDLEKLYSLGHLLLTKIQPSQQESPFTLPQGIELEAYRIQETFSGSINLDNTAETEFQAPVIKGSGPMLINSVLKQ
jgi:type I restriction enzyme R subunit